MSGTLAVDACQDSHPAKAEVRILLADDHALLRRGLREFLRDFLVEDGLTPTLSKQPLPAMQSITFAQAPGISSSWT